MKSRLVITGFLLLGVLLAGCDKTAPPSATQKGTEAETPEKKLADLMRRAEQGNSQAQFSLGSLYHKGEGVLKDAARAVEWYQKAATQGHASAQSKLGGMYHKGEGVPEDVAKAVEWWQKAAEQEHAQAQFMLGSMYRVGHIKGVPRDAVKAAEWYQKAVAQGDAPAQIMLGTMYADGERVPKDTAKAFEWLQKAAAQGNGAAQVMLGMMYAGAVCPPADEWQKAAAQGNELAQIMLSTMYAYGHYVPQYKADSKSVDSVNRFGDRPTAKRYYGEMLTKEPLDLILAYAWLNLAASSGKELVAKMGVEKRSELDLGFVPDRSFTFEEAKRRSMTAAEIAEAQRISSAWKKGQILTREGRSASASTTPSATPGNLSKKGTGTLFLVNAVGQAVTNHHVVAGCGELRIEGRDGLAKVITEDAVNDLALVQIPSEAKASAAITAEPGKLRQGEHIVVFGFPLNAVLSSGGNLTPGVVSALTGLGNNTNQIQITAPIQPGSSGSPVLNKKGEVVGMVSMKLSDSKMARATGSVGQNVNFAVNGQTLRTFFDTHKVAYRSGAGFFARDKSTADLADEARKWTLVLECWK